MSYRISVPTSSSLPSHLRVNASNNTVAKNLGRLSRTSLISLALLWLNERTLSHSFPHLKRRRRPEADEEDEETDEDPDDLYPPCTTLGELRQLYDDLKEQKGSKRDVVSRVLEGDWRDGLTLYQLATVDMAYFEEHNTSQTWTSYQILKLEEPSMDRGDDAADLLKVDKKSLQIPRFHPSTFLQNLQRESLPDVKAHYHFYRPKDFPVLLLRILVLDSPYNTALALSGADGSGTGVNFDSSRTVYLAFPDGSPSLFVSKATSVGPASASSSSLHGEGKSWQSLIVNGVPKALSRPRERFTLKPSGLVSKNLNALLEKRGTGRGQAAGGGWSIFADEKDRQTPLDSILPPVPFLSSKTGERGADGNSLNNLAYGRERALLQKAKAVAEARFGTSGIVGDGKGLEKFEVVLHDAFPSSATRNGGGPRRRASEEVEAEMEDEEDEGEDDQDEEGGEDNAASATHGRRKRRRGAARRSQMNVAISEDDMMEVDDEGGGEGAQPPSGNGRKGWSPSVRVTLQGPHVFAGVRQLVEAGIVDGERMPGWMTGEEGVTAGVVRQGRIRGHKGSGI